jgi:type VI secretion system secreted protein VgrG
MLGIASFAALLLGSTSALAGSFLGSAEPFATLGAATQTNTGASTINGDVGVYPGTAITGTGTITLVGSSVYHINDAVAQGAEAAATTAYNTLAALPITSDLTGDVLGVGVAATLTPGVYKFDSSAQLNGMLTLSFSGASNEKFIFQIGSTLTTASASGVLVTGGNSTDSVYWQVGSSATLGTTTDFAGNIIALDSISLNTGADILCGRAFALTAAVTMQANTISNDCTAFNNSTGRTDFGSGGLTGGTSPSVPEPSSALLLAMGLIGLTALVRTNRHAGPTR